MGKIYVITSGKGGTGKTTTAINLAAALNKFKNDVIVVDTNLTTPNLSLYLGAPIVPISLTHVLQGKAEIEDAIYEHHSGIKVVPSSLSLKDLSKIDHDMLYEVSKKLKKASDHVLFDSAAGLTKEALLPIHTSDRVIVIVNPNILSVTDALKTIKIAEDAGKKIEGAIINRVTYDKSEMTIDEIKEMLEVPIIGIIPEDISISRALAKRNSVIEVYPRSKAARAYIDISAKLIGKKKKPSLFEKVLEKLGLRGGVK